MKLKMNKNEKGGSKMATVAVDLSKLCRSTFTLTFAVEVLGFEVWEDCTEGWLELMPCVQGLKLQCYLYPGQSFDLDVMMWPHVSKICYGFQYTWVRTWLFLERRWLAFSISFAFPVRVVDLQVHVAVINPTFGVAAVGANAKSDKNIELYLPPLKFGMRRYFAPVLEEDTEDVEEFVQQLIWQLVEKFIPWTCFDILFDVPHVVTDIRHQDACLDAVRNLVLSRLEPVEIEVEPPEPEDHKQKDNKKESKINKLTEKKKTTSDQKTKFEIKLSGESILAGTGRIVPFETVGDRVPDSPEIIVLISSNNLPAQDDVPIVFLNVENLIQIPLNEFKILRITQLYTKWKIGDEEHCSERKPLKTKSTINFNDHRAFSVPYELLPKVTSEFLDSYFKIELRGIRVPSVAKEPRLFGYEKSDRDFGRTVPKPPNEELDFLIANTRINGRRLAKGINAFLRGEYPLYPPRVTVEQTQREIFCTNDINAMRMRTVPDLIVGSDIILQAQMTLEVSIGVVGCKTRMLPGSFSRMFCRVKDTEAVMTILRNITEINEEITLSDKKEDLLSGFAVDTGRVVVLYLEGPKDGHILRIWDMTEDFYPKVKPMFSCSDRYSTRIYPEMVEAAVPFVILKMFVPLGVLLACPPIYARPALPIPTRTVEFATTFDRFWDVQSPFLRRYTRAFPTVTARARAVTVGCTVECCRELDLITALLKIDGLVTNEFRSVPSRCEMPTAAELKSFKLELCVAPRSIPVVINENTVESQAQHPQEIVSRIIWDK